MTPVTLVYGNVIHSKNIGQIEYLNNAAVVVGHHGKVNIFCKKIECNGANSIITSYSSIRHNN